MMVRGRYEFLSMDRMVLSRPFARSCLCRRVAECAPLARQPLRAKLLLPHHRFHER